MFDPNFDELVAVMARDVAVRTTHAITGAEVCNIATAFGYDAEAVASAWATRAGFEADPGRKRSMRRSPAFCRWAKMRAGNACRLSETTSVRVSERFER